MTRREYFRCLLRIIPGGVVSLPMCARSRDVERQQYAALGELAAYRTHSALVVRDVQLAHGPTSPTYVRIRQLYDRAGRGVEAFLDEVALTLKEGKRSEELTVTAQDAARAAEVFFGEALASIRTPRHLPAAPFAAFAAMCIDYLIRLRKRRREYFADRLQQEMRWVAWDRVE